MQATITPKFMDAPREGGKYWSVKGQDDIQWKVHPDIAQHMARGIPVTVEYTVNDFNGKQYNMVKALAGTAQPAPQPAPQPAQPAPVVQPQPAPAPAPQPASTPRPSAAHINAHFSTQAEEIFVTGIVGRAMGSGKFGPEHISVLTKAAIQAWQNRHGTTAPEYLGTFEAPPTGQPDDEIPF